MPKDSGAHIKHVHNVDEWFYVLDGTVDFELEGETTSGQDGDGLHVRPMRRHRFSTNGFHRGDNAGSRRLMGTAIISQH
jgi:quercetin dioxygenase-like cupin family protein